ncbi:MAG: ABC-2 family transporter protein [Verrucomicrobiales bacterium]|nr:ABC-2 family transporter protein [Verrucomicrobiales bacterium]
MIRSETVPPKGVASSDLQNHLGWRGYAGIFGALWRNSIVREMSFQANFLFWLFVELLWFALQLAFNSVIYLHTDRIGTWTKWEVVLLIGASHFIQQLFQAFFLVNCAQLSEQVHSGKMDFMLLLPVNTRFLISLRYVDLSGFVGAGSGLAVMFYAMHQLHLSPTAMQILGFALLCVAAILVHYSLMFIMATLSFWTVRAQGLVMAYYNLFSIARLPDAAFRGTARTVFTFAIPMLLVANVPVKVLLSKLGSPAEVALTVLMCVCCLLGSILVWHVGLRRYSSASS